MGKDKSGVFHPGKGKPSGINKEEGTGVTGTPPEKINEYLDITKKYMEDDDTMAPSLPVRHPNRNTSKGEDTFKAKENTEQSDKTINDLQVDDAMVARAEELPAVLTKDILTELAGFSADFCVSLYLPTSQAGVEVNEKQDLIAFKNALQTISRKYSERGYAEEEVDKILSPGHALLKDEKFWTELTPGLAVFIADGFFKYMRMPVSPMEEISFAAHFTLAPLASLLADPTYFYVLVLNKQKMKLFRADAYGMEFINVELPESMDEVKRLSDKDATTWRTGGRGGTGGANFHGIGGGNADDKTNIATYFEAVDDILFKEIFNKENASLLLAGVEYLVPIYKSVCDYHNVWEQALTGSYKLEDTNSLHTQAMEIMKPLFTQKQEKALAMYANQSASDLTTSNTAVIIPAAYYGRVSHLFVEKGAHIRGTFDEQTSELKLDVDHSAKSEENLEDQLDKAVTKVLLTGGEVYLLEKDQMPDKAPLVALLRY